MNTPFHTLAKEGLPLLDHQWYNKLIYGDNLAVMQHLIHDLDLAGKVTLIYIDPPFATGEAFRVSTHRTATISMPATSEIAYQDFKFGTDYINFLKDRLILLRELLSDEGTIYVHIGVRISHYVRLLMDEIFGFDNFISEITRIKCNPKNFKRRSFGNIKDTILVYSKTKNYVWNEPRIPYTKEEIERLFPKVDAQGRRYTTTPLHAPGETSKGSTGQPWRGLKPPEGRHWRYPPHILDELDRQGLIEWSSTGNPRKKLYADEVISRGKLAQDVWEFKDPPRPKYPTEKNLEMLKLIVATSSRPGDIVLDAFCGSGTTLLAAELLGRKWIGIDNSSRAIHIALERLRSLSHKKRPPAPYEVLALQNNCLTP